MPEALQEGWVHVLGPVGTEVHAGHEQHEVKKKFPVASDGGSELGPAFLFGFLPDLRFGDAEANEEGEQRGYAAEKEQRTPTPSIEQKPKAERGQQIAESVTLLKNA